MSRLGDLYKAMETLRKEGLSLNEDLERQVSELEEDIIKKEILPVVTETIEPNENLFWWLTTIRVCLSACRCRVRRISRS